MNDYLIPGETEQMDHVASLPVPTDWFAQQGVPMHESELEPGWPILVGIVHTDGGPLMVFGNPGGDGVQLWAEEDRSPQEALDALEQALGHGAAPDWVAPRGGSDEGGEELPSTEGTVNVSDDPPPPGSPGGN